MLKAILLLAGVTGVLAVPVSLNADGQPPDLEIGCPEDLESWNHGCRVRTNNTVDAAGDIPPSDPDSNRLSKIQTYLFSNTIHHTDINSHYNHSHSHRPNTHERSSDHNRDRNRPVQDEHSSPHDIDNIPTEPIKLHQNNIFKQFNFHLAFLVLCYDLDFTADDGYGDANIFTRTDVLVICGHSKFVASHVHWDLDILKHPNVLGLYCQWILITWNINLELYILNSPAFLTAPHHQWNLDVYDQERIFNNVIAHADILVITLIHLTPLDLDVYEQYWGLNAIVTELDILVPSLVFLCHWNINAKDRPWIHSDIIAEPASSRPSSTNEPSTSSHGKTSSKGTSSTDGPAATSSKRKTSSTETSSVSKTSTQSITKTSTDTAPTAVPTDDSKHVVDDLVEVLEPEDEDDRDLALGLGLGLGLGIPGAGLLGWGGTLAAKLAKDEGLFKFAKSFLKGSTKMNDEVLRSMAKFPKAGDFPPRPPHTPQPPPGQPPPNQPPPDQPPPNQPPPEQPPPEQPPPEQPPPEQPQPPKQPEPDSRVDRNALDYIKRWRSRLERQGLSADQATEVTNEFQSDMAITERAMAKSAARSSPEMGRNGGRPGGLQAPRIQEAANLAAYGAGAVVVSQSLAHAGVPHIKIPKVLKDLKKTKINEPGKAARQQALKDSITVITDNSRLQGKAVHDAATALAYGEEGPAIDRMLRRSGVPEENMSKTLSDISDAIKDAGGDNKKAYGAALDVINEAASLTSRSALLSRRGIDEIGNEGAIDVIGASYMLWHGLSQAMWDSVLEMDDERHSKIREEILALGPPPALTAWREFAYPYQRTGKVDDGDRNTTSSALATTTSWSNSTALPTSSFLPTSSALSSSFSTTSTSLSTSTPLSKSTVLPTSSVLPSKTSEPTPTSTGKQPPDNPKQYPPGRQPCTAATTALKERWAFLGEIKNGLTPEFRKEIANKRWAYLSEVEYQIRALDDETFKPRAFEPWYTDKLRQNTDYRAKALELILFDRAQFKSMDDFMNRRDNYAKLLRTHPDLHAKTANTMRTVLCEYQAAFDGGEIPPGMTRLRLKIHLNRRRGLLDWLISLKMV